MKITLKNIETWFCTLALAVTVPQNSYIYKQNLKRPTNEFPAVSFLHTCFER